MFQFATCSLGVQLKADVQVSCATARHSQKWPRDQASPRLAFWAHCLGATGDRCQASDHPSHSPARGMLIGPPHSNDGASVVHDDASPVAGPHSPTGLEERRVVVGVQDRCVDCGPSVREEWSPQTSAPRETNGTPAASPKTSQNKATLARQSRRFSGGLGRKAASPR